MRSISGSLQVARHTLMSDKAWLLFVEIPTKTGKFFRLVRSSRHIHAGGLVWQACSIEIELPAEDVAGSLGRLMIAVPNVSRLPMAYIDQDDADGEGEILGATITCRLAHESSLATFDPGLVWEHVALAADATPLVMQLDCGHPAAVGKGPRMRYDRIRFPQMLAQTA